MFMQGVIRALAALRDDRSFSPDSIVEAFLAALQHGDNAGNPWDDSALTATYLEALGNLAPSSPQVGVSGCRNEPFLLGWVYRAAIPGTTRGSGLTVIHLEALGELAPSMPQGGFG